MLNFSSIRENIMEYNENKTILVIFAHFAIAILGPCKIRIISLVDA